MSRRLMLCCAYLILCLMVLPGICLAGPMGKITLKDGSQVYGEIVEMTEGKIQVKTLFHEGRTPSPSSGLKSRESIPRIP